MPLPTAGLSQPQNTWNTSTTQSKTANNPSNATAQSEQNTTAQAQETYTANTTGEISVNFDEITLLSDIKKIVSGALFEIDRHIRLEETNVEKHLATLTNQNTLQTAVAHQFSRAVDVKNKQLDQLTALQDSLKGCNNQLELLDVVTSILRGRAVTLENQTKQVMRDCYSVQSSNPDTHTRLEKEFKRLNPTEQMFKTPGTTPIYLKAMDRITKAVLEHVDVDVLEACLKQNIAIGQEALHLIRCHPSLLQFISGETNQPKSLDDISSFGLLNDVFHHIQKNYGGILSGGKIMTEEVSALVYMMEIAYSAPYDIGQIFNDFSGADSMQKGLSGSRLLSKVENLKSEDHWHLAVVFEHVKRCITKEPSNDMPQGLKKYISFNPINQSLSIDADTEKRVNQLILIALDPETRRLVSNHDSFICDYHKPNANDRTITIVSDFRTPKYQVGGSTNSAVERYLNHCITISVPAKDHPLAPNFPDLDLEKIRIHETPDYEFYIDDESFFAHNPVTPALPDPTPATDEEIQAQTTDESETVSSETDAATRDAIPTAITSTSSTDNERSTNAVRELNKKSQNFIDDLFGKEKKFKFKELETSLKRLGWKMVEKRGGGSHKVVVDNNNQRQTGISATHNNQDKFVSRSNLNRLMIALENAGYHSSDATN